MKSKFILASIAMVILSTILVAQVNSVKAATTFGGGPITSPISYFILNGKVGYKKLFILVPAKNVTIQITNTQTNEKYQTKTNYLGSYSISLKTGQYNIVPNDSKNTIFQPRNKIVDLLSGNISGVNFIGLR